MFSCIGSEQTIYFWICSLQNQWEKIYIPTKMDHHFHQNTLVNLITIWCPGQISPQNLYTNVLHKDSLRFSDTVMIIKHILPQFCSGKTILIILMPKNTINNKIGNWKYDYIVLYYIVVVFAVQVFILLFYIYNTIYIYIIQIIIYVICMLISKWPKDALPSKSSEMSGLGCVCGLEGSPHTGVQVCVCELNI